MSENPYEDESGTRDYSPEQEAEAEVNLDEPSSTADVAWSPPDRRPVSSEFADDDPAEETIDQRISQELPEEGTSYGRPETGGEDTSREPELLGGDDPDAIPADQDVLGGDAATYGYLTAALGLGAVLGSIGAASSERVTGRGLLVWAVVFGLVNLVMALAGRLTVALAANFAIVAVAAVLAIVLLVVAWQGG